MTRIEERLAGAVLDEIRGLDRQQAVRRLFERGLLSRTACEQLSIRSEIARLAREGVPRCEAFHATARTYCCSYEKVRNMFYKSYKN